jgi:hypothetical protein
VNGYGGGGGTAVVNGDLTGFTTYYGQLTNLPPKNHGETAAQRRDNTRLGALAKTQDEGYHHHHHHHHQVYYLIITFSFTMIGTSDAVKEVVAKLEELTESVVFYPIKSENTHDLLHAFMFVPGKQPEAYFDVLTQQNGSLT